MSSPRPLAEAEGQPSFRPAKRPRLDPLSARFETRQEIPEQQESEPDKEFDATTRVVLAPPSPAESSSQQDESQCGVKSTVTFQDGDQSMRDTTCTSSSLNQMAMDMLEDELTCGMCAGIYIDPVVLHECGHSFCGSCVRSLIKSLPPMTAPAFPGDPLPKPPSCPHCRHAPITEARPSRLANAMVHILLKCKPEAARPERELQQAREIYTASMGALKFPIPPTQSYCRESDYWKPCRSCYPTVEGAWKCSKPIPRPHIQEEASRCVLRSGFCPDGHNLCSSCDQLCPADGPMNLKCGICGDGFCGDSKSSVCTCVPLAQAKPAAHWNLLQLCTEDAVSELMSTIFRENWTEIKHLSAYLASLPLEERITPGFIFSEVLTAFERPDGPKSITDPLVPVPQFGTLKDERSSLICGSCTDNLFCSGLYEWWLKEYEKPDVRGRLPKAVLDRPNCRRGRLCSQQHRSSHAVTRNHICQPVTDDEDDEEDDEDEHQSSDYSADSSSEFSSSEPRQFADNDVQNESANIAVYEESKITVAGTTDADMDSSDEQQPVVSSQMREPATHLDSPINEPTKPPTEPSPAQSGPISS
ncbi:hypothetical protein BD324DRAFT_612077 [Kockovaella imperatae]|uniref:RING-type domain-containing protein n=1 Tax=Kockovaella imperatae TaxID=4999 RepID=A0A1Y1URW3_9TREE|nr:hypothetical protein BD324DRAFT_612077 [Kockovaella imperatae]ORX40778.1 hypothetical protein BD324DRAFT_612077 [Kockovaella imperatae]